VIGFGCGEGGGRVGRRNSNIKRERAEEGNSSAKGCCDEE